MWAIKFFNAVPVTRNNPHKYTLRLTHKINTNKKPAKPVSSEVVNYIENTPEYREIKDKLPISLLKKYNTPESMYLINKRTAKEIAITLITHINSENPLVEINPGFGYLSQQLLQNHSNHLYLYESLNHFSTYLNDLQIQNPGRVTYKLADFFGMWKLAFKDKLDQGNRIAELLGDLATDDNGRIIKIVGSMPGLNFVKHIINNIIFQNTTHQMGRSDMFIIMPGYHYELLTDSEIQHKKHKSLPALFQLLFDYKILTSVPRAHFLPWTYPQATKRYTMMDEYRLYLVNITQKEKLPCPPEYLPLLWYFFKPHMLTKSTRVIPMLEQWIPGCGVWLISGQDPPDTNKEIAPNENDAALPHMTIFTEFGDLNLHQKLTVFKKFISWPEFEQCQFRVTMENNLPRFVVPIDSDEKDTIPIHMDDIDTSDAEIENEG